MEIENKTDDRGLVIVYTGEGKGKTTAAMGLAVRAAGYGRRVLVVQFVKAWFTGEKGGFESVPGVEFIQGGRGFVGILGDKLSKDEHRAAALETLAYARERVAGGEYGVVILDEVVGAVVGGLIEAADLHELLDARPAEVDLVLTGRHADLVDGLVARADLVTEMQEVKHPYDNGILARESIDY